MSQDEGFGSIVDTRREAPNQVGVFVVNKSEMTMVQFPDLYVYEPAEDITVHELAILIPHLIGHSARNRPVSFELLGECQRHFRKIENDKGEGGFVYGFYP